MKVSARLQLKIERDLGLKVHSPARIPRGRHQDAAGQWAWSAERADGAGEVGSEDTMTECLAVKHLSTYRNCHTGRLEIVADPSRE